MPADSLVANPEVALVGDPRKPSELAMSVRFSMHSGSIATGVLLALVASAAALVPFDPPSNSAKTATPVMTRDLKAGALTCLAASPDGKRIAVGTIDGRIYLCTEPAWVPKLVATHPLARGDVGPTDAAVTCLAWSTKGVSPWHLASGSNNGTVIVLDSPGLGAPRRIDWRSPSDGDRQIVTSVAWARDSLIIAGSDYGLAPFDKTLGLFRIRQGDTLLRRKAHFPVARSVTYASTLHLIASGGQDDKSIRLWSFPAVKHLATIPASTWVTALCYTRGDKQLVSGDSGGSISVWESSSSRRLHSFKAHSGTVMRISIRHDSSDTIASCGEDSSVSISDARGVGTAARLSWARGSVTDVDWLGQSKTLVSASLDGKLRFLWVSQ